MYHFHELQVKNCLFYTHNSQITNKIMQMDLIIILRMPFGTFEYCHRKVSDLFFVNVFFLFDGNLLKCRQIFQRI